MKELGAQRETMEQLEWTESLVPDDVALKIASFLQVFDLCSLGSCSRFWRKLCGSDFIWISLYRERWPSMVSSTEVPVLNVNDRGPAGVGEQFSSAKESPDGEHRQDHPRRAINKPKRNFLEVLSIGLRNYKGWILGLIYGCSFGVELTIDNIIAQYFYDRFDVEIRVSGAIAASFGLANIFSQPIGGVLSDEMGKRFGIRGRLWSLWVVLTVAGLLCILLGQEGMDMSVAGDMEEGRRSGGIREMSHAVDGGVVGMGSHRPNLLRERRGSTEKHGSGGEGEWETMAAVEITLMPFFYYFIILNLLN